MPPSSRLSFSTEDGQQLRVPREWEEALVVVDCDPTRRPLPRLYRNDKPLPLYTQDVEGTPCGFARWPRSDAGSYELCLTPTDGSAPHRQVCFVAACKLDPTEIEFMLDDLQRGLPASIAIAMQRAGAFGGVEIVSLQETTLAEELARLGLAIDGSPARTGLVKLLRAISAHPYRVLRSDETWSDRHRASHVNAVLLARAFSRVANVDADGLPVRIPERRVMHSADVYENRMLKAFHAQLDVRLRDVIRTLSRQGNDEHVQRARSLLLRLSAARRDARFLDDVSQLSMSPSNVTMVMLKRDEYRAVQEGFLDFRRRLLVQLHEPALDAPLENVPFLYEIWGTLTVISEAMTIAATLGYEIREESLWSKHPGELWIRMLCNNRPAVSLAHPVSGVEIDIIPQRRYAVGSGRLQSMSFPQVPDLAIEIRSAGETQVCIFDPKYKLHDQGLAADAPRSRPKKQDIDTMHAYRDAIRTEAGERAVRYAAILYPGADQQYGVGLAALSARPGRTDELRAHVQEALLPAMTRSS